MMKDSVAKDMALFVDELLIQSPNHSHPMLTPQIALNDKRTELRK